MSRTLARPTVRILDKNVLLLRIVFRLHADAELEVFWERVAVTGSSGAGWAGGESAAAGQGRAAHARRRPVFFCAVQRGSAAAVEAATADSLVFCTGVGSLLGQQPAEPDRAGQHKRLDGSWKRSRAYLSTS